MTSAAEVNLPHSSCYLRFGRCVSAEAAALFAAFDEFGLAKTLAAADAALALVTSLFDFCDIWITSFRHVGDQAAFEAVSSTVTASLAFFFTDSAQFLALCFET